jgi:hypothetical protein
VEAFARGESNIANDWRIGLIDLLVRATLLALDWLSLVGPPSCRR